MHIQINYGVGEACIILCTSLCKSKFIADLFQVDSCFVINNPMEFSKCSAKALSKKYVCKDIIMGNCKYQEQRNLIKTIEERDLNSIGFNNKNNTIDFKKLFQLGNSIAGQDIFFLKEKQYEQQKEFRIIWQTYTRIKDKFIDIKIPDAIQYCKKINL